MKYITGFLMAVLFVAFLSDVSYAGGNQNEKVISSQSTVSSLLNGLHSENLGLKTSSVFMIGELQISEAIIPLMKILRDDENVEARISAALALYKIGSPMSINAVKQSIKFDESERVSKLCANFYNDYQRKKIIDEETNETVSDIALK
ncbi:MAG: HEAT repeat domain-containing protein [Ignavibacteriales bacterium]